MTTLSGLPISVTYKSSKDFNKFVAKVARTLGVQSRTNRFRAEALMSVWGDYSTVDIVESTDLMLCKNFAPHLRASVYAIQFASKTGRLHTSAQAMIDSLSGYQYAKLVIKLALVGMTINDIVRYLNGKQSLEIPVA